MALKAVQLLVYRHVAREECVNKVLVFLILFSLKSLAAEVDNYNIPVRALGMGGVYTPFVNDPDAPLINPAALGFTSSVSWEIADIFFGVNGQDAINNFSGASVSGTSSYNNYIGKKLFVNAYAKSAWTSPYFGVAGFYRNQFSMIIRNPAFPNFDMTYLSDYGVNVAGAIPIGPIAAFGGAIKRVNRWGGPRSIGLSTISAGNTAALLDEFQNKGVGYGFDMAYMMKFPAPLSPSLAVTWTDVGSTSFLKTNGTEAPPRIKDNLTLGLGALIDLPGLDLTAGMEYKHILDTGVQIGKKLHFGTELSLPLVDIRTGMSQGYASWGLGVDLAILQVDIASYTVEAGEYPGQTPESRLQIGITMELAIDADFKFSTKEGKRKKVKQRR